MTVFLDNQSNVIKALPTPLFDTERNICDRSLAWLSDGTIVFGKDWKRREIVQWCSDNAIKEIVLWSRGGNSVRRIFLDSKKRPV